MGQDKLCGLILLRYYLAPIKLIDHQSMQLVKQQKIQLLLLDFLMLIGRGILAISSGARGGA